MTLSTVGIGCHEASDGREALRKIHDREFDLIILDLELPSLSGKELIKHVTTDVIPVIVLTVRDSIADKIHLFEDGAIDYMVKPFDPMELLLRIKSALKRIPSNHSVLRVGPVDIDCKRRSVSNTKGEIALTTKEFDLLCFFARNQDTALSRNQILASVWGYDAEVATRTVDIHVGRLRSKIPELRLSTLHRSGYRLEST